MSRSDAALTTDQPRILTEAVEYLNIFLETASMMRGATMRGGAGHTMAPEATVAAATGHLTATGQTVMWVLLGEATAVLHTTAGDVSRILKMLTGMLTEKMTGRVMASNSVNGGEISRDLVLLTETGQGEMSMGGIGVRLGMAPASAGVLIGLRRPQRSLPRTQLTWVGCLPCLY